MYKNHQVNHVVNICEHVKASIRNMHRSGLKESWFEKKNEEMILIKGESTSCSNHRGSRCHSSSCCCSSPQCVELKQNVAFEMKDLKLKDFKVQKFWEGRKNMAFFFLELPCIFKYNLEFLSNFSGVLRIYEL